MLSNDSDRPSDSDLIIRILYFCEEPRTVYQIMYHCWIDRSEFMRFSDHCMRRGLLKLIQMGNDVLGFVITPHGRETLETAQDIMKELGLDSGELR